MLVWTVKTGEPLPIDGESVRLHRTGLISSILADHGHDVVWWTSTFYHQAKRQRFHQDTSLWLNERFEVKLLHAMGYRKNVSLMRIVDHWCTARKFANLAATARRPDIVLCAFPTIELSAACVGYGLRTGVPVVIDIRDLWPDIFVDALPRVLRGVGMLAIQSYVAKTRYVMKNATALVAMSEGCLKWGLRYAGREQGPNDCVFPLGYPRPTFTPSQLRAAQASLATLGVDPTRIICWFVGTFGKHYDIGTVIEAARELSSRGLSYVQFVLSGDGEFRERWTRLAKGLGNIVFTGWINSEQIAYMMNVADIGLLPVDGVPESLPNKLFEYLAAGLPVVSSLRGEVEGFLRRHNCGLTYRAKDPKSLLEALETLLTNEHLRREMGSNAKGTYETEYSADAVYSRMVRYLERMVEHKRSSTSGGSRRADLARHGEVGFLRPDSGTCKDV